jgi:predicted ATPase
MFVGREGVLATLGTKLDDAYAERGSVVMLVGEPGIGKTAIASAFSSHARERGAIVLSGSCFEGDWQPAYGPWVEALGAYAAFADHGRLARIVGASAPALAQLIPALRSAPEAAPLPRPRRCSSTTRERPSRPPLRPSPILPPPPPSSHGSRGR